MKVFLIIFGIILVLPGGIWFFQGINFLPGSFMTGDSLWAYIGGGMIAAGLALFILGLLWKKRTPRQ
jgi:membrane associated rhomboid family serine protease